MSRRTLVLAAAGTVLVLAALVGILALPGDPSTRPAGVRPSPSTHARSATPDLPRARLQVPVPAPAAAAQPARPVRVSVPRVGITSPLEPLELEPDGSLQPPSRYGRAGWYDRGPRPGAVGPAVIIGHVDSTSGPAIFFHLDRVRIGDDVQVTDAAGVVRHFTVDSVHRYRKSAFPTQTVYGPTPLPVLRLVTCTGAFDVRKRSYVDNLVVFATMRRPRAG